MESEKFNWIRDLQIQDQNNIYELEESLQFIDEFINNDNSDNVDELNILNLKTNLSNIILIIKSTKRISIIDLRRIVKCVRELWFIKDDTILIETCSEFIKELIQNLLIEIYEENDLERADDQLRRCVLLTSLFSDYYDDYKVFGISKYDYIYLIILIQSIEDVGKQMINLNYFNAENYCRFIYLIDKVISNWLANFDYIDKNQFKLNFLSKLKSHLALLAFNYKNNFKLVSISLCTIIGNIHKLESKLIN